MEGEEEEGGEGERERMMKRGKIRKRSERSCSAYLSKPILWVFGVLGSQLVLRKSVYKVV